MKVLVTGSTGRIGKALLLHCPPDVELEVLLDPLDQSVPELPWYRVNICHHERVLMAVTCADPDVVIHLAAATDVDRCEEDPDMAFNVNRNGSANIAEACSLSGAKMVLMSTDYVFDGLTGPYTEHDKPNPVSVYGRSKLEGENSASACVDNLAVVRISVPFGLRMPDVDHNFASWLIGELEAENSVRIAVDQRTTPAYIEELVEVLWKIVKKDVSGTVHYGTSDRLSRYEMALEICRTMGYSEDLVQPVTTDELDFTAKRPLESGFITDKVHEILGRPPVLFRNALYRMIENSP